MTAAGSRRIADLASVVRSKNAKSFGLTLDMMFDDPGVYRRVKESGVLTRALFARLYHLSEEDVRHLLFLDQVQAVKVSIRRPIACGGMGDADVYGCQQHAPLYDIEIPWG